MGQSKTGSDQAGPLDRSYQPVRASRGAVLICRGWPQEAALRMLMNSLDEEVAERPRNLIACGATEKVLRDWECYHATVDALKGLKDDETLLVQSGKPAGVFETNKDAPRVLITDSSWAASWTSLGTQEALPTAFQIFDAVGQEHFGGDLAGKLVACGGMGAAGGALPLAAGLLGAAFLGIEVDGEKIKRRIRAGYCDYCVNSLDEALRILKNAVRQKQAVSVGLVGNCADVIPELASRGVVPDILTDQTSAHDLLNGYVPSGLNAKEAATLRANNPGEYLSRARDSIAGHFAGMLALKKLGSVVFEFGNSICAAAHECGVMASSSAFPGFVEAYLQPLLSAGLAPVRCVALSGEPGDIHRLDDLALEIFPDDAMLNRWIPLARKYARFQGLPARVCWMDPEARVVLAERLNSHVAEGVFKAPLVMALDTMDSGLRPLIPAEPEGMTGGSHVIVEGPILNALLQAASGASWVSLATGAGHSHATVVMVADGTPKAARALPRVLKDDYARGILRLAAVGDKKAQDTGRQTHRKIPMPDRS